MLKIIAFYLPQFHSIPLNDKVWGKGFTEWNSVKSAHALFSGHNQPRVPEHNNYYNLLDEDTILWQTQIAAKNSVYGFCIYHYWFSGKLLLNKPLEIIRDSKKIHFPYCICWANESWKNAWVSTDKPVSFLEQKYGDMDEWKEHFDYLLTFFCDEDYIVENNKPLLVIYRPESIPDLNKRLDFWNQLAIEHGFDGIEYAYQQIDFALDPKNDDSRFTYAIEYQPRYALTDYQNQLNIHTKKPLWITVKVKSLLNYFAKTAQPASFRKFLNKQITNYRSKKHLDKPQVYQYSDLSEKVISRHAKNSKSIPGMFVGYDDTPRKSERGMVIQSTPEEFDEYLLKQTKNVKLNYDNDYLFLFAWNEWGESGYLEPDNKFSDRYLQSIKKAVSEYDRL